MNILLLGPERQTLIDTLTAAGDAVLCTDEKITVDSDTVTWADFLISYGYRHIISAEVLEKFPRKAINLHISYLPWNRGADPNLWSYLDDTPRGVTIHYLDEGLDTGDILIRKEVPDRPDDTLRTSYDRLSAAVESLLAELWPKIRSGLLPGYPQPSGGSRHRLRDRRDFRHLLTKGWDTPVADLIGRALFTGMERQA